MSKVKDTKSKLKSKLEAIKKINDNPNSFSDNIANKYLKDLPSSEVYGKKIDDFLNKNKSKKDNKKDIFEDLIEIAEGFLTKNSNIQSNDKLFTKGRLKQHGINASLKTVEVGKEIVLENVKKTFFAGDGICGTNYLLSGTTIQIKPEEIDFLNLLTVNPTTPVGKIVYEPTSPDKGKEKVNRELYTSFNGVPYLFNTNSNNTLFSMSWNQTNQLWDVTGFSGKNVENFFQDYYSNIEIPDINTILKNTMLMTISGGEGSGENISFNKSLNDLNRLVKKLFSICGSEKDNSLLKNQNATDLFNENDDDIESYFDFDDVEGIDVDDEDARLRKVLRFTDCENFEIPVNGTTISDFVYFSGKKNLNDLIDTTLNRVSTQAYLSSDSSIPQINFNINLINSFILNLPKSIISSLLSPKIFLPILIVYKVVRSITGQVLNVKDLMKQLSKLFTTIIKDVFWKFIREFWKLVKNDLISLLSKIIKKIFKNKKNRYLTILKVLIAFLIKILNEKIDNCYSLFTSIINAINTALSTRSPLQIPGLLLMLSDKLPGYSQDRAYMNIIERLESVGINTGPIYGESSNLSSLVKSIIDGNIEEMDQNSFVKITLQGGILPGPTGGVVIPPGIISGAGKLF